MTDERGHAAGSAGPRKSRRVGKGALLDSSRGQSRARAHSPAKTGVNALEDALWQNPGRQNLDVCWKFRHEADALSHRTREGKVLADRVSSG